MQSWLCNCPETIAWKGRGFSSTGSSIEEMGANFILGVEVRMGFTRTIIQRLQGKVMLSGGVFTLLAHKDVSLGNLRSAQIGRASCRVRV